VVCLIFHTEWFISSFTLKNLNISPMFHSQRLIFFRGSGERLQSYFHKNNISKKNMSICVMMVVRIQISIPPFFTKILNKSLSQKFRINQIRRKFVYPLILLCVCISSQYSVNCYRLYRRCIDRLV
jgi:hypothetical protein